MVTMNSFDKTNLYPVALLSGPVPVMTIKIPKMPNRTDEPMNTRGAVFCIAILYQPRLRIFWSGGTGGASVLALQV